MDQARFRALAAAYGSDLARWPEEEQAAARTLLDASSDARALLLQERGLDELLAAAPDREPSADLLRRVAEIPARHAPSASWSLWPFGRVRTLVAALGAAAAMGVAAGAALPERDDGDQAGLEELSEMALSVDISREISP
jgi:hypothetical protein